MKRRNRIAAVAVGAAVVLTVPACSSMNQQDRTCTVHSKERLIKDGSSADKRVYTSCGAFVVNDSLAGGFNSQDTFNQLVEGRTYEIRTGDYRNGFFSMFPNIIEVKREVTS